MKKAGLQNFAIFRGKLQACNFIKNRIQQRWFPLNIAKFLRTPISKNIRSVTSCFCIDSFTKFRYFINRLQTTKLLTIQSKFINLCFISKRLIYVT